MKLLSLSVLDFDPDSPSHNDGEGLFLTIDSPDKVAAAISQLEILSGHPPEAIWAARFKTATFVELYEVLSLIQRETRRRDADDSAAHCDKP